MTKPETANSANNGKGELLTERSPQYARAVRVIFYASTSNKPYDISIEDQMIIMAEYSSNQKGWVAAGKVIDSQGGRTLRKRPALRQIEQAMRDGQVDVVLATEPSRLSRRHSDLAELIGLAERYGVEVWTTTIGRITNMMAVALQMVAGLGLDDRRSRTVRRHEAMNKDGRHIGRPPYGYDVDRAAGQNGILKICLEEARIVSRIYHSYLAGPSLSAIVKELNEICVPSPRGGKWNVTMLSEDGICGVLHDMTYTGLVICGMYETFEDATTGACMRVLKPRAEWKIAKGRHEPIVAAEVFDAVQKCHAGERTAA
ncbi:DNA invertase Pin-like site-specific DNA recombinase [Bradyrhizobium huanghuaihaiense]|uniref:DNA invertase Pin-like site-specific DNA recombinase n=1 Tax=Bradyrhizobium huanghuaihaiense TaxID=990078 RepID=A0A562S5D3_9BRAD|nr:recombinase family protein [Bradyrhizobium huanghuaihaiense]TWI76475.1 DNA invertase Pin-like site-specific DNA recombinase [Bradyrhizobium huanghuaihaiense]